MKKTDLLFLASLVFASCQMSTPLDQVISKTYVHKYGFETTEEEWDDRSQDGQVVSMLKNGVKVTHSYENGELHGLTTYTFPDSPILEKIFVYDQGNLIKERLNDPSGMPIKEEMIEYGGRKTITMWDEKGAPLSVEEYENDLLMEAKYYTSDHELETSVSSGEGERVKRDREGKLISRDHIFDGKMIKRETYHPNGNPHTISHYQNHQLHGLQSKYTANNKPLMQQNWKDGVLDGEKTIYRNGYKIAVVPYINGKKNGLEVHYDDLGNLMAEMEWKEDKKHGFSKTYTEDYADTEWFFKGQSVSAEKFQNMQNRGLITNSYESHY